MIQLAPRHLPLKWCDSTWECGDLGLITHLWWEGGVNICASLRWATATDILALYDTAHVCLRVFFMSLSPQLWTSHLTSSKLIFLSHTSYYSPCSSSSCSRGRRMSHMCISCDEAISRSSHCFHPDPQSHDRYPR